MIRKDKTFNPHFQTFAPQVGGTPRRGGASAGRADGLPTLFHVVGEHSADLSAVALTPLLRVRACRVRQAHTFGTSLGEELEFTAGKMPFILVE